MVNRDNSTFFSKSAFLKFWLFPLVVIGHAANYEAYGLANAVGAGAKLLYSLEVFELSLGGTVMAMYIAISGYGFMLGYTPEKTLAKWKRRFFSLFIPWLMWNTVMWLLGIALEHIPFIAARLNSGFGYELTLRSYITQGLLLPADGPFWFISNIMVAMLLAPVIYYLVKNRWLGLVSIAALLFAVYKYSAGRYSILMTVLFFTEAAYCVQHLSGAVNKHYGALPRLLALAVLAVCLYIGRNARVLNGGIYHAINFSVSISALWVLAGDAGLGKVASGLETYRFWVYGAHYLPLECVKRLWLMIGGVSVGAAWAGMLLCPVVAVLVLIAAGWLVRRYCWPLWCLFCGGDPKKNPNRKTVGAA